MEQKQTFYARSQEVTLTQHEGNVHWASSCGIFLAGRELSPGEKLTEERASLGGDGWGEFFGVHANNTNSEWGREDGRFVQDP